MRKTIFTTAWQMLRAGFAATLSEALRRAWAIIKMTTGKPLNITYEMVHGGIRRATVLHVTDISTVSKGYLRYLEDIGGGVIVWRTFRITNLVNIEP